MFIAPDWRDAGAYSHLARAELRAIAWEFLRRNPGYQQAWGEFAGELRGLVALDTAMASYVEYLLLPNTEQLRDGDGAPGSRWTDREHEALQDRLQWGLDSPDPDIREYGTWNALTRRYAVPWGVMRIVNPMSVLRFDGVIFAAQGAVSRPDWGAVSEIRSAGLQRVERDAKSAGAGVFSESQWLALLIDLSAPLEVIKADVMAHIDRARKGRIKRGNLVPVTKRALRKQVYVEYLRVLDGVAGGASAPEVGEVLAPRARNEVPDRPRDKRFRAALKAAQQLRDGGYRMLPRLESTASPVKKK